MFGTMISEKKIDFHKNNTKIITDRSEYACIEIT